MNRLTSATLMVLIATSAWGQAERAIQEPDRTVIRSKTTIDFADVSVEGGVAKPLSSYIPVARRPVFPNLITIRGSFTPELQKSVDSL